MPWEKGERPGYFGRRRDQRVAELDAQHGKGRWQLFWVSHHFDPSQGATERYWAFADACKLFYEESYFQYLKERPADIEFICSFDECYDNGISNIESGFDYTKQEAYSTHIQDIAIRNVLRRLGRRFADRSGGEDAERSAFARLLQIRSSDSNGYRFGPGNIPFAWPQMIEQPSKAPRWANAGSVEDFWQSNKHIFVWREGP